jgi:predicted PurR-regulated permease PerM
VRPGAVLLLAAAFCACALLRVVRHRLRRGEGRAWADALVVAAVAALWVAAALAIAQWAGPPRSGGAASDNNPYYAPKW